MNNLELKQVREYFSALAEAGLLTATMLASLRLVICMDTAALSCPGAVALAQAELTVTSPA